jgi:hypothetical protein
VSLIKSPFGNVLQVMDSVQTLDAGRRSAYDPDEIDEEQKERDVRNKVPSCGVVPGADILSHMLAAVHAALQRFSDLAGTLLLS